MTQSLTPRGQSLLDEVFLTPYRLVAERDPGKALLTNGEVVRPDVVPTIKANPLSPQSTFLAYGSSCRNALQQRAQSSS